MTLFSGPQGTCILVYQQKRTLEMGTSLAEAEKATLSLLIMSNYIYINVCCGSLMLLLPHLPEIFLQFKFTRDKLTKQAARHLSALHGERTYWQRLKLGTNSDRRSLVLLYSINIQNITLMRRAACKRDAD